MQISISRARISILLLQSPRTNDEASTIIWRDDFRSLKSHILIKKPPVQAVFLRFIKFVFGIIHFASYGLLLLVRPRI